MRQLAYAAILCAAVAAYAVQTVQAEPLSAAGRFNVHGEHAAAAGQRAVVADGNRHVAAGSAGGFSTDAGGQGQRTRRFQRSADGSATADGHASASGPNGSASRDGSYTRNADGTAYGERDTTVTNARTGVTWDGSTRYGQGAGVSRSLSCTDAAGQAVSCGRR
jgi:hypothetical protein